MKRSLVLILCLGLFLIISGCDNQYQYKSGDSDKVGRYTLMSIKKPQWAPHPTDKEMLILKENNALLKIDTATGRVWEWNEVEYTDGRQTGYWSELTRYEYPAFKSK